MIKRFNRFELKYSISSAARDRLLEELGELMVPDVEGGPRGAYTVTSLYFDTPDLAFYRAKIEGLRYRRKVRIRVYGELGAEPDPEVMLEIKQRIARTTQKRRLRLPLSQAHDLCGGRGLEADLDGAERAVADEVDYLATALQLAPVCVVSYERRAFVGGTYEPGLRVTLDEQLVCTPPAMRITGGAPRWRVLSPNIVILEVKANDRVPLWLSHMLARHSCTLRRFSKYCAAVATLGAHESWRHVG